MKGKDLLLLGGLAIGAYLIYKYFFTNKDSGSTLFDYSGLGDGNGSCSGDQCPSGDAGQGIPPQTAPSVIYAPPPNSTFAPTSVIPVKEYVAPINKQQSAFIPAAITGVGYTTPNSYVVTQNAPTVTAVIKTGARVNTYQFAATAPSPVPTQNRAALITVGSPMQQITQAQTAPKIVKIGGVSRKVM